MNQQINYHYEIMIVDLAGKSEITTIKSLSNALAYSEKLWQDSVIKETSKEAAIEDKVLGINLQVHKVEHQSLANETAFLLSATSANFDEIEKFRHKLLVHLISKLGFVNARVVSDSITEQISRNMYPLIKKVENTVRKNLVKMALQKNGLAWWEVTASKSVQDKVAQRKNVANTFNGFVDTSACLTDFNDISELLQKAPFANADFKINWNSLAVLRDKMMTHAPLVIEDYTEVKELSRKLLDVLEKESSTDVVQATSHFVQPATPEPVAQVAAKVAELVIEEEPKMEPKVEAKVEVVPERVAVQPIAEKKAEHVFVAPTENAVVETVVQPIQEVKIEVKVPERQAVVSGDALVSEIEFLTELKRAESVSDGSFINLKTFVVSVLAPKGYAAGYAYSLSKALNESGKVVLYDAKEGGLAIRAIRSN